jgi:homoserine dehydrogenase
MNAVLVKGDAVGPTLYYGAGAGAEPTASSVIADIVDLARSFSGASENRVSHLGFNNDALQELPILPIEECQTAYYLRMQADDKPGVLSQVTTILSESGISIEAVIQKEQHGCAQVPLILLTNRAIEKQLLQAAEQIEALDTISGSVTHIRVETLA